MQMRRTLGFSEPALAAVRRAAVRVARSMGIFMVLEGGGVVGCVQG